MNHLITSKFLDSDILQLDSLFGFSPFCFPGIFFALTFEFVLMFRLDRETSGIMIAVKTKQAMMLLERDRNLVKKEYLCIVRGSPRENSGA